MCIRDRHIVDPNSRGPVAVFFTCALAATSVAWLIKWKTGCATNDIDDRLDPAYISRLTRKYYWTTGLMAFAAALAFLSWAVGLSLAVVVTLYFLRAPETPDYITKAPEVEGES